LTLPSIWLMRSIPSRSLRMTAFNRANSLLYAR